MDDLHSKRPYEIDEEEMGGLVAREADPYDEELTRLQQEIIDSITRDINMGAGVFEGETTSVDVKLTDEDGAGYDDEADAPILR